MSEAIPHKLFTVDEANELVPELNHLFELVRMERQVIDNLLPDIEAAVEHADHGGGSVHGVRYVQALERIADLIDDITDMGVIIKDVDTGLCDFLFDRGSELVLLCWRAGEPEVLWWHGLNDGFQGRRNVDELGD